MNHDSSTPPIKRKTRPNKAGYAKLGYVVKGACERCSAQTPLVVHHKDRSISNNEHSNLETLCRVCHVKEHGAEISDSQRRPEVNTRRGASISKSKKGKSYPKCSEALRENWKGEMGTKLREKRKSEESRLVYSIAAAKRWEDPEYRAKRKLLREQRNAQR